MTNSIPAVRIETLGCRLNQIESESLAVLFKKANFFVYGIDENAFCSGSVKLCILNTCTVTGKAEQKARRIIRYLLREYPEAIVLVTGCYAQLDRDVIQKIAPRVCVFSGKKRGFLAELPQYLNNFFNMRLNEPFNFEVLKGVLTSFEQMFDERTDTDSTFKLSASAFLFHSRAGLKVQDGCNNSCTFCRIRLARGASVSLPPNEAVSRLQLIEDNGANEVVISGINLSQYNSCGYDFSLLLELLLRKTKKINIRISSLYPENITSSFLKVIKNERICPHFHLSVQSGSDTVLQKMHRRYTAASVRSAVEKLREIKNNPFLGCDIITGFPDESDEDFEQTYELCRSLRFTGIHAFPFSARPGTKAFTMKPKIPERTACRRAALLNALAEENLLKYIAEYEGKTVRAIIEKPLAKKNIQAVTENYLTVNVFGTDILSHQYKGGEAVTLKIINGRGEIQNC